MHDLPGWAKIKGSELRSKTKHEGLYCRIYLPLFYNPPNQQRFLATPFLKYTNAMILLVDKNPGF